MDEERFSLKEVIYNDKKHATLKRLFVLIFILLMYYASVKGNEVLGYTLVFIVTTLGIIFYISKMYFYNEKREVKDIINLSLFIILFVIGIYLLYR